ncbi:MAG TPA: hypothetical protein VFB80_19445 [Pirellulaceae bacterium]|nr:hypothetical protein [Pirellulaceae bacterium]
MKTRGQNQRSSKRRCDTRAKSSFSPQQHHGDSQRTCRRTRAMRLWQAVSIRSTLPQEAVEPNVPIFPADA